LRNRQWRHRRRRQSRPARAVAVMPVVTHPVLLVLLVLLSAPWPRPPSARGGPPHHQGRRARRRGTSVPSSSAARAHRIVLRPYPSSSSSPHEYPAPSLRHSELVHRGKIPPLWGDRTESQPCYWPSVPFRRGGLECALGADLGAQRSPHLTPKQTQRAPVLTIGRARRFSRCVFDVSCSSACRDALELGTATPQAGRTTGPRFASAC